jgi:hypothetical protein
MNRLDRSTGRAAACVFRAALALASFSPALAHAQEAQRLAAAATTQPTPPPTGETPSVSTDTPVSNEPAASPSGSPPPVQFGQPTSLEPSPLTQKGERDEPSANAMPEVPPPEKTMFIELGGRLGYAIGKGQLVEGTSMNEVFSGAVPLIFDLAVRFRSGLALGLYAQVGVGIQGEALDECDDCSLWNLRLGLQALQHFNSRGSVDPWIGVGIGVDDTIVAREEEYLGSKYRWETSYKAVPEFLVQAGIDIDIGNKNLAFGPFVAATYAVYNEISSEVSCAESYCADLSARESETTIPDSAKTSHGWLLAGVRGTFMR